MKTIRFFLIIILIALLSGCSRIKFAYHQLDWLLPFYLGTYMELTDDQDYYLEEQVKTLLTWHCATQLGNYAALFREANANFQTGKMSQARLDGLDSQIEQFWLDLMRQVSPVISQLLLTANNQQLVELFNSLGEDNREWLAEFQEQTDAELHDEYRERMTDALERWFGPLQEIQQQSVQKWVKQFEPLGMEGFQMRRKWQSRLRELTTQRDNAIAFKSGIDQLLLQPELLRSPPYQRMMDNNRKATMDLLYLIGNQLDNSQRKHLAMETLAIAQDFDDLACKKDDLVTPATLTKGLNQSPAHFNKKRKFDAGFLFAFKT
jgi:hypothetical protein